MTEGDYIMAIELIKEAEGNIVQGNYDFAHINILEALALLGEGEKNELGG